jgi:hypothetical protein
MIAEYGVMRHQPYANRTEHVNIGIVSFPAEGGVRLHLADNLRKLKAFDPSIDLNNVRSLEETLAPMFDDCSIEQVKVVLSNFGSLRLGDQLGRFRYETEHEYLDQVSRALASLVSPHSLRREQREPKSRLFMDLRKAFQVQGWLAHAPNDISKHLIVPHYLIAPEEQVKADFAARNGKLHVTETLDLRAAVSSSKRTEAMSKALVFDLAAQIEETAVMSYVIVAASDKDSAAPTMRLLHRYSEQVLYWDSHEDMGFYMKTISAALGRPQLELPVN